MLSFLACFQPAPHTTQALIHRLCQPFQLFILHSLSLKNIMATVMKQQLQSYALTHLAELDVELQAELREGLGEESEMESWDGQILMQVLFETQLQSFCCSLLKSILDDCLQTYL